MIKEAKTNHAPKQPKAPKLPVLCSTSAAQANARPDSQAIRSEDNFRWSHCRPKQPFGRSGKVSSRSRHAVTKLEAWCPRAAITLSMCYPDKRRHIPQYRAKKKERAGHPQRGCPARSFAGQRSADSLAIAFSTNSRETHAATLSAAPIRTSIPTVQDARTTVPTATLARIRTAMMDSFPSGK